MLIPILVSAVVLLVVTNIISIGLLKSLSNKLSKRAHEIWGDDEALLTMLETQAVTSEVAKQLLIAHQRFALENPTNSPENATWLRKQCYKDVRKHTVQWDLFLKDFSFETTDTGRLNCFRQWFKSSNFTDEEIVEICSKIKDEYSRNQIREFHHDKKKKAAR
jgi:hypothetical protein